MRVLIVDDHEVVRRGVRSLLLGQTSYELCGEAVDGQDALVKARALKPDVIVMDVSMPNLNGLECTRLMRNILPECEILILSQHESPEMARQALNAGARGYVAKRSIAKDLISALDRVSRHECFFDPAIWDTGSSSGHLDIQEILQRSSAFEQALRESEQLYRSTFELAAVGVAHVKPDGRWLRVNKKLCEIVGYTEAELMQLTFQEITHPEDLPGDLAETEKLLSGSLDMFAMKKRYIRKDGSPVWVNLTASVARDAGGKVKHFITVVEDIHERRESDVARARLAAIVESSDDAIISKDLDGVIRSWNVGAMRIFEHTAQEAVGRSITIIIPPERHDEEAQILQRLRKGERIEHFETVRVTKSGKRIDVSLTISPVRNSKGQVIGVSKIARDITERKQAEERERQITAEAVAATAKFRGVFEQTTVFAAITNKDGVLMEANRLCLDACGFRAEDVLGKPFWEAGWWRNFEESRDKIRAATPLAAQGIPYREMLHYSWADGTERLVDFALYPILDDKGEVLYLHPTGVDVTDIKRAEENYRELAKRLDAEVQARTKELDDRNADVLRQSEQVRRLSLRLMITQDEERRHIARDLHDSAGQTLTVLGINLAQLIHDAERIAPKLAQEGGKIQELVQQLHREIRTTSYLLHPPLLDETGLPSALSWYVQGLSERSGLAIDLSVEEGFERLPADMELAIFRLVQESLTNVHRHSGSKTACIRLAREGENVSIEVRDQGHGIPPHRMAEIKSHGSGLGVRGLRERLRQFGGEMDIESSGSGTRVLAKIPLPPDSRPDGIGRQMPNRFTPPPSDQNSLRRWSPHPTPLDL
jgi:PAS domain S-box-containing protein